MPLDGTKTIRSCSQQQVLTEHTSLLVSVLGAEDAGVNRQESALAELAFTRTNRQDAR